MNKSNTNVFATIAKVYIGLDLLWAIIIATFGSVIASQGLTLAGSGAVAATTGGIGTWILAFFVAAFQGAIFLVVFSVFGALLFAGGAALSKNDPQLQRFLSKYALTCLCLDVLWAVIVATFASSILAHFGVYLGAAANATMLGSLLLWIIGFVVGFCQGAIFLTVGTLFIVFGLLLYALCTKK